MQTKTERVLLAILALLAAGSAGLSFIGGNAHAASGDPRSANESILSYAPDRQSAAFRAAQYPADSTSVAVLTSTTTGQFITNGRQTLTVGARFTTAASTCKVRVLYEFSATPSVKDATAVPFDISAPQTLTATSYTDGNGRFIAPAVAFDTEGATHVYVVIDTGPTAGQMDLWVGSR